MGLTLWPRAAMPSGAFTALMGGACQGPRPQTVVGDYPLLPSTRDLGALAAIDAHGRRRGTPRDASPAAGGPALPIPGGPPGRRPRRGRAPVGQPLPGAASG